MVPLLLHEENIRYLFANNTISSPILIVDRLESSIIISVFIILHKGESFPIFNIDEMSNIK